MGYFSAGADALLDTVDAAPFVDDLCGGAHSDVIRLEELTMFK